MRDSPASGGGDDFGEDLGATDDLEAALGVEAEEPAAAPSREQGRAQDRLDFI